MLRGTAGELRMAGCPVMPGAADGPVSPAPIRALDGVAELLVGELAATNGSSSIRGLLAESQRVSEERRAEAEQLRLRLEQMAALDKLKSDFMNLATHELRSPLAVVYGYLCMMETGALGELGPKLQEAVRASLQSVEMMTEMITELVEMARLDEGRLGDTAHEKVDLTEVVVAAAGRVESSEQHRLRLELGERAVPVLGERGQLLRVFANLVDNALKYSPGGGEVRVSLHRRDTEVRVDVADTGLGIPATEIERLFTRFGRIVTPATQGIAGTGLGLYLCRETARRFGGDVTVASVEGEGSTFTVRLPVADGALREVPIAV